MALLKKISRFIILNVKKPLTLVSRKKLLSKQVNRIGPDPTQSIRPTANSVTPFVYCVLSMSTSIKTVFIWCVTDSYVYTPYTSKNHCVDYGELRRQSKRKKTWSRAVFSNLQRKGLEKRFEVQKYVTKPDRRQLAAMLGLTDAQVYKTYL